MKSLDPNAGVYEYIKRQWEEFRAQIQAEKESPLVFNGNGLVVLDWIQKTLAPVVSEISWKHVEQPKKVVKDAFRKCLALYGEAGEGAAKVSKEETYPCDQKQQPRQQQQRQQQQQQ